MAMESNGMGIGDVLALVGNKDNDGLFGGGAGGILALIIVFILIFGNGGFGFGNRGYEQYATNAEVQRGFDNQTLLSKVDAIGNGLCDSGYANAQLINGVNTNIMQQTNQLGGAISQLGFDMQQGCCGINRNIDSLRYDAQLNTRDITDAIHCEGQATRALINENEVTRLRTDLQSAQLALSNANQTSNILNNLGRFVVNPPCPYQTCSCGVTIA